MSPKHATNNLQLVSRPKIFAHVLNDDGWFPNSHLPALLYQQVAVGGALEAGDWEAWFIKNDWRGCWRNGIYNYNHYHSTSHEVLGAYKGAAKVQLGGDHGITIELRAGDVLVIPAGVAHKNLGSTSDFGMVGAYPGGMKWDLNYGNPSERPKSDRNIAGVPLPEKDPLYGTGGPLISYWGLARKNPRARDPLCASSK